MKVEKPLSAIAALDPQERRQAVLREPQVPAASKAEPAAAQASATAERTRSKGASFNLQLNQQLSSMQSAESYLDQLGSRLRQLKLTLSRELSAAQGADKQGLQQAMGEVNQLLSERAERSGGTLDATLKLRLTEPLRSRFSLEGLDSLQAIQNSGKETLLFSAGRQSSEPIAVVLDDNMSGEQVLRRFNVSLGQVGVRAELAQNGELKFSARESDWQALKPQLAVQGEGKLFKKGSYTPVHSQEEQAFNFPAEVAADNQRDLRRNLDAVVAALDKVGAIRDQLSHRQQEIREFLARQADQDETQWAADYASSAFNLLNKSPASYAAVTQTVVAQANISRFAVVSLLS